MSGNQQKTPFIASLNRFADERMSGALGLLARSTPASVVSVNANRTIVVVKFEVKTPVPIPQVTCPVVGFEWIRYPIQPGTFGYVIPADFYMGGMSGLGGGVATQTQQANLTNSVFFPCGNTGLDESEFPDAVVIYGPDGAVLTNVRKTTKVRVDGDGNVIIWGAKSFSWDIGGYGQRITQTGPTSWTIDNYTQGATVITNDLPINPPEIPVP